MNEAIATPRKEYTAVSHRPRFGRNCRKTNGRLSIGNTRRLANYRTYATDLFLPTISPPTLLQSGDKIRFAPISPEEYEVL